MKTINFHTVFLTFYNFVQFKQIFFYLDKSTDCGGSENNKGHYFDEPPIQRIGCSDRSG